MAAASLLTLWLRASIAFSPAMIGTRSAGSAQSASIFSMNAGTPAAIAPGVSVVGNTRSASAVIVARWTG